MIRTRVQLTEEQARLLRKLAAECWVSVAQLIRGSVEALLERSAWPSDQNCGAGRFRSGQGGVAARHDAYLAEARAK